MTKDKDIKALINLILSIERRCKNENLFLQATIDPYKDHTSEAQQGPLVTRLFDLAKTMKKAIARK